MLKTIKTKCTGYKSFLVQYLAHPVLHLVNILYDGVVGDSCCSQAFLARSSMPLGLRPSSSSNGENPVDACGTSRMENKTKGISWSQFFPLTSITFLSICLRVLLNRSTRPSVCGWCTDVFTPSTTCTSLSSLVT